MSQNWDIDKDELDAIHRAYVDKYESVLGECNSRITEWRWASGDMYSPRPYGTLIDGSKGRWLKSQSGVVAYSYGFEQGNAAPRVCRFYLNGRLSSETFYLSSESRILSLSYRDLDDLNPTLIGVSIVDFESGHPSRYAILSTGTFKDQHFEERYTIDRDLIRKADGKLDRGRGVEGTTLEYDYDSENRISRISWKHDNGDAGLHYLSPSTQQSDKKVLIQLRENLASTVARTIARYRGEHSEEALYAFAIVLYPQATSVYCAFATDVSLNNVVEEYLSRGYRIGGDSANALADWLRWSGPEDGWYVYPLVEGEMFNAQYAEAHASGVFTRGQSESKLCLEVIKDLDERKFLERRPNAIESL